MATLSPTSLIVRGDGHVETVLGDQVLMMSLEQGKYFAIDTTAKRIWELVRTPACLQYLVDTLLSEFDVDAAQCEADVRAFTERLIQNGLVRVVTQ